MCAFGALIKEPLLSEHELLNVHPSLLPRWRGAAPIERAIMAGDAQTGVSIMRLTAGLDSGPVCLAGVEPIAPEDTYGSLAARLQRLGGELLVARAARASAVRRAGRGRYHLRREGRLGRSPARPGRPAIELERVVRALHPRIGARVALADGTLLGVHRAVLTDDQSGAHAQTGARASGHDGAGAVRLRAREGRLLLDCTPGTLELLEVQPPGGRAMDASAYLRGHGLPGRR